MDFRQQMRLMACSTAAALAMLGAQAEVVHVVEQIEAGETAVVRDSLAETGVAFRSATAPTVSGFIFTHWTISTQQPFVNRDVWGRAADSVSLIVYETTVLTAHYVAIGIDADGDGMADGDELYWYGDLDESAVTDTDGDGIPFKDELELGTNPHFADAGDPLGLVYDGIDGVVYNPKSYPVITFRCEPEGSLFETISDVAEPGTTVRSPVCDSGTTFAYWKVGGNVCRDAFGRALDKVTFEMPSNDVTVTAVSIADSLVRAQFYWYGHEISMESDTDGDGRTFAQEIELGTNPLFPDDDAAIGVTYDGLDDLLYNPLGLKPYVVRSSEEDLFETFTEYALPGTEVSTPTLEHEGSAFAYWTVDGKMQRDVFGRALDAVSFVVPSGGIELVAHSVENAADRAKLYWYGTTEVDLSSDTDGDGLTLADEIANGTNPLFADSDRLGGVEYDGCDDVEVNLQSHELIGCFVVGGKYVTIQTNAGVAPVVADVNRDGLWDLIVVSKDSTRVFVNIGSIGSPAFEEIDGADIRGVDLQMNSTEKLGVLSLDIQPVAALSATLWGDETLLVSDAEGRIWYYRNGKLQHKVWGGSHPGFANGLRLAAVDWDDDGDLDCLCGTAEGKLMLLRDPKVGRPTNLRALAGVDNVLLVWDPNQQSRIRGYKVYRKAAEDVAARWGQRALPILPTYRDYPEEIVDYDYQVSSISRHYVAGEGLVVQITYDPTKLKPVRVEPSGLTEKVTFTDHAEDGVWTVRATGGEIAAGGGTFFTFVFEPLGAAETSVNVVSAEMKSVGGATIPVILPSEGAGAKIVISPFVDPEPAHATVSLTESVQVTAGESFEVVVSVAGEEIDSTTLAYEFEYDDALFTRQGHSFTAADVTEAKIATITLKNVTVKDVNGADAVIDACGLCTVAVAPKSGGDIGGGGDEEDPDTGIVIGDDGTIVDWGDEPQPGDDAYRFGFRVANMNLGSAMGKTGETVEVPVGIHAVGLLLDTTVNVKRWAFSVRYDERQADLHADPRRGKRVHPVRPSQERSDRRCPVRQVGHER